MSEQTKEWLETMSEKLTTQVSYHRSNAYMFRKDKQLADSFLQVANQLQAIQAYIKSRIEK